MLSRVTANGDRAKLAERFTFSRSKTSNGWAPEKDRPLRKSVGVPDTPTERPLSMAFWITASYLSDAVHALKLLGSMPRPTARLCRSASS